MSGTHTGSAPYPSGGTPPAGPMATNGLPPAQGPYCRCCLPPKGSRSWRLTASHTAFLVGMLLAGTRQRRELRARLLRAGNHRLRDAVGGGVAASQWSERRSCLADRHRPLFVTGLAGAGLLSRTRHSQSFGTAARPAVGDGKN